MIDATYYIQGTVISSRTTPSEELVVTERCLDHITKDQGFCWFDGQALEQSETGTTTISSTVFKGSWI